MRDFAGFRHRSSTTTAARTARENRELCARFWAALRDGGPGRRARGDAALRSRRRGRFSPTASSREPARAARRRTSTATAATSAARPTAPTDLIDPVSTLCGAKPEVRSGQAPVRRASRSCTRFLNEWTQTRRAPAAEVANYLKGTFLRRAAARLGRLAPGAVLRLRDPRQPRATTGTSGSTRRSATWRSHRASGARRHGEKLDDWWRSADSARSTTSSARTSPTSTRCSGRRCCKTAGFKLPTKVHIHGFLTVDGEKMSKSKGTFVLAATYLEHLDPAYLRYYYACKLGPRLDDLDLNLEEFVAKVNSRPRRQGRQPRQPHGAVRAEAPGLSRYYPDDGGLLRQPAAAAGEEIAAAYEACDYARAMRPSWRWPTAPTSTSTPRSPGS